MHYTRLPFLALLVAALVLGMTTTSCSDPQSGANNGDDSEAAQARRDVLENLGDDVILQSYTQFETRARELETAAGAYADSLSQDDRDAAQQAWRDAIDLWQRAEVFQLGPAGVMGQVVAGEDLRDQIYSWPIVNPCRVDQELVEGNYADPSAFAQEPVNVRGLDALEYLLFETGTDNACAPNSSINTDGTWDALGEQELQQRRADYAATLATLLTQRAEQLRTAWAADGGDFLGQFSNAGDGSDTYATSQEALNAVSDAMFYLDKETKDMKLAQPTGLIDCVDDVCPEERESRWANRSLAHVRNNLVGFRQLYHGGAPEDPDALGFDDLLRGMGADALADDMTQRIDAAITAADAVPGTMLEALQTDPESVTDLYDAVKSITDLFKSQFFDVLDLEVPRRGEGDND